MYKWTENNKVIVYFNDTPFVSIRYAVPSMTDAEIKAIKKYPFINKKTITVRLIDKVKDRTYEFDIPKGYCYDGMTIPRFAWTLIGVSKENNGGLIASMIHDYLTEHKELIMNDRAFSTNVFDALLCEGRVNPTRRFLMKNSVAMFQTLFCKW